VDKLILALSVVVEVETTHFKGTVIRAVASPDTAVINHVVETLRAVYGSRDRAYVLTRSGLTLLARDRLVYYLGLCLVTDEVAVHTNPMHLTTAADLILTDHRDVIL